MNNTQTIKTETWNDHQIRFIWHENEWWAVLKDITDALELNTYHVNERLNAGIVSNDMVESGNGKRKMLIVNEIGIYDAIFSSRKQEAKEFKQWVYNMLKELRKTSGLEGFQIFRMLDKDHQKEMMAKLRNGLRQSKQIDYIKANTITNKAVSSMFGHPKMIKKGDMTPEMLAQREPVLEDTVELMSVVDKFGLDCSVSEKIRERYH